MQERFDTIDKRRNFIDSRVNNMRYDTSVETCVTPVKDICQEVDIDIQYTNETMDGYIVFNARINKTTIYYNPNQFRPRINFTIAHELSHWIYDYDELVRLAALDADGCGRLFDAV